MELYSFQVQRALADAFLISSRREQKRSSGRNEITIFHDSTLYIDFVVSTSRILSIAASAASKPKTRLFVFLPINRESPRNSRLGINEFHWKLNKATIKKLLRAIRRRDARGHAGLQISIRSRRALVKHRKVAAKLTSLETSRRCNPDEAEGTSPEENANGTRRSRDCCGNACKALVVAGNARR